LQELFAEWGVRTFLFYNKQLKAIHAQECRVSAQEKAKQVAQNSGK